jgi:hypothetical protein
MAYNFLADVPVIPINALFGESLEPNTSLPFHPGQFLAEADVIFGVNVMEDRNFLVYGRKAIEEIALTGKKKDLRVVRIALDQETDELEKLIALVTVIKGKHDYRADGTRP